MYKEKVLSYLYQDLEPFLNTHLVSIHYHKHYMNYLNKLNSLLLKNNYNFNYSLEELIYHIEDFDIEDREDILFNLVGVLNHNLYFGCLNSKLVLPKGNLKDKINNKYGSFDNFYNEFILNALKLKGSGYTFLVIKDNDLEIINLSNQINPLMFNYIPLFTIDLWEHSYYLSYESDKKRYLDNLKNILDFTLASNLYDRYNLVL